MTSHEQITVYSQSSTNQANESRIRLTILTEEKRITAISVPTSAKITKGGVIHCLTTVFSPLDRFVTPIPQGAAIDTGEAQVEVTIDLLTGQGLPDFLARTLKAAGYQVTEIIETDHADPLVDTIDDDAIDLYFEGDSHEAKKAAQNNGDVVLFPEAPAARLRRVLEQWNGHQRQFISADDLRTIEKDLLRLSPREEALLQRGASSEPANRIPIAFYRSSDDRIKIWLTNFDLRNERVSRPDITGYNGIIDRGDGCPEIGPIDFFEFLGKDGWLIVRDDAVWKSPSDGKGQFDILAHLKSGEEISTEADAFARWMSAIEDAILSGGGAQIMEDRKAAPQNPYKPFCLLRTRDHSVEILPTAMKDDVFYGIVIRDGKAGDIGKIDFAAIFDEIKRRPEAIIFYDEEWRPA